MFTHSQYINYRIYVKMGRDPRYILDRELNDCSGIVIYDKNTGIIPELQWKDISARQSIAICVTDGTNYTYSMYMYFDGTIRLIVPNGGKLWFSNIADAEKAANHDLSARIRKINRSICSISRYKEPALKWVMVYNKVPAIEMAEFKIRDKTYVFTIEKCINIKKEYCVCVSGPDGTTSCVMGEIVDRAKHGANNILKLILSGRRMSSICAWEFEVGWEHYLNFPVAQFIPKVLNGRLVNPIRIVRKYTVDNVILKNWSRTCDYFATEAASFTTTDGTKYEFIAKERMMGGSGFVWLTIDNYRFEPYEAGITVEDTKSAANNLLRLILDGRDPESITSSELMKDTTSIGGK